MLSLTNASETVLEFLSILNAYAPDGLRKQDDLACLLQHAYDTKKTGIIGELAFQGKYLWKLQAALRKESSTGESFETLEKELLEAFNTFHEKIAELVQDGAPELLLSFRSSYLQFSEEAAGNIIALAHDFHWMKNWELEMNREQENFR